MMSILPVRTPDPRCCSLAQLQPNDGAIVLALQGGRGFVSRLASLGFVPGARVQVIQNYGRGPLIVLIRQARVALGRREAESVIVRRDGSP